MNALHAYRLDVIPFLSDTLRSKFLERDPVFSTTVKSVLCGLLTLLISEFTVGSLPHFDSLIDLACLIYTDNENLCVRFWELDFPSPAKRSLLEYARSRFPLHFEPFLRLLTALSSSPEAANYAYDYLSRLETFTIAETEGHEHFTKNGDSYVKALPHSSRDLFISHEIRRRLKLITGTIGRVLSFPKEPLVVLWHVDPYSAIDFFFASLEAFFQSPDPSHPGTFPFLPQRGVANSSVPSIMNLVTSILPLMSALFSSPRVAQDLAAFGGLLIKQVFGVIKRVSLVPSASVTIITSALDLITRLCPLYRSEAWFHFRQSGLVSDISGHQSTGVTNQRGGLMQYILSTVERPRGTYPVTVSFLNLVSTLLRCVQDEAQQESLASVPMDTMPTSPTTTAFSGTQRSFQSSFSLVQRPASTPFNKSPAAELQTEVLLSFLSYIQIDIFQAYDNWRYAKISERFRIGTLTLEIFDSILVATSKAILTQEPTSSRVMESLQRFLYSKFLADSNSMYHLLPFFNVIGLGSDTIDASAHFHFGSH